MMACMRLRLAAESPEQNRQFVSLLLPLVFSILTIDALLDHHEGKRRVRWCQWHAKCKRITPAGGTQQNRNVLLAPLSIFRARAVPTTGSSRSASHWE